MQPVITATPQLLIANHEGERRFVVQVSGRYGGGYTSPGHTAKEAAGMIVRDSRRYDCGEEPIAIGITKEVADEIDALFANGEKCRACLTCKNRPMPAAERTEHTADTVDGFI